MVSEYIGSTAQKSDSPPRYPVGTDNSKVMYMYRQNCMMMDRYASYV